MKTTAKITAILLVLALAGSVSARVITVEVTGVVTSTGTGGGLALDGSVIVGSTMTGYCTYDTDTPDQDGSDWRGLYEIDAISMTIGNYTFTHNLNSDSPILFSIGTIDYNYVVKTLSPRFDGTVTINGLSKTWDDINWSSSALTLLDVCSSSNELNLPDTLPESVPDISIFDWRREFYVRFVADDGSSFYIYGEITSLTVVPAPFEVTPASVDFHYYLGGPNPEPQILSIWAKEVDTLNWQITEDCNWLDVSPTSGQSSGEVDEVTLTVDISGLSRGSYHCQLTVFDPNVSEDYILHLPVNLFIGTKLFVPSQYLTIQAAIDAADDYDMVLVADGNYTGDGNKNLDFRGKPITVCSENGPNNCTIDCENSGRGFYFHSGETAYSVVDGFTITNGRYGGIFCFDSSPTINNCIISGNAARGGGGIHCLRQSHPTITNCTISDNLGSGIYCRYSSPAINNCIISGNTALFGGAISLWDGSNPTITNCTITGNNAAYDGGAISCVGGRSGSSSPVITNCTITGNSSYADGGGIYCRYSSPTITNCIISGNTAKGWGVARYGGGGICWEGDLGLSSSSIISNCIITGNSSDDAGGGILCKDSSLTITNCTISGNLAGWGGGGLAGCDGPISNCIIWNNVADNGSQLYWSTEPTYSCIQNWSGGGAGNIDTDPCFVEPGYWDTNGTPTDANDDFWVDGDYHLLRTSPCIDAASDANVYTDIEGNVRPFDFPGVDNNGELPEFDMGAYELVPIEAEMKLVPQMLNCSSKGKWVKAHFVLPEEFLPEDVDVNESAIAEPMGIESEYIKVLGAGTGPVKLEITFDREAFCDSVTETGEVEVTVIGSLTTSRYFYATDTIKIKP